MPTQCETVVRVQHVLNLQYLYSHGSAQHLEVISRFLLEERENCLSTGDSYPPRSPVSISKLTTESYESTHVPVNLSTAKHINR